MSYGTSVEGRPLQALHLPGDSDRCVWVTAGIHGLEFIGVETALAVAAGAIARPLEAALWVLPILNPDAYVRTWEQAGRGAVSELRKNARGVDLNRNFPLPCGARPGAIPFTGSPRPGHVNYRGPSPMSEPESAAVVALATAQRPWASANLHSFMGSLIHARVTHLADWRAYGHLACAFRNAQRGARYRRLGSPIGDVFTGELEDWLHHERGCWSVCVECLSVGESVRQHLRAPTSFWRFNPRDPKPVVVRDAPPVRALLEAALHVERPPDRPRTPAREDSW